MEPTLFFPRWVFLIQIRWVRLLENCMRVQGFKPRKKQILNKLILQWPVILLLDKWVHYFMMILRNKGESWIHYQQASTYLKFSFIQKIFSNISNSTTKWWRRRNWKGGKKFLENSKGSQILNGRSHCTVKNRKLILQKSFKRCFNSLKIIMNKFYFSD